MRVSASPQTVGAAKSVANLKPQLLRHRGAHHHLQGSVPHAALCQRGAVVGKVLRRGAHNPKATQVVAQAEGDELGDHGVLFQGLDRLERNIARWHIDVEHAAQDQLHGAALGTHHHINTGQVLVKGLVQLKAHQQQEGDGGQTQAEQQHIQGSPQRA